MKRTFVMNANAKTLAIYEVIIPADGTLEKDGKVIANMTNILTGENKEVTATTFKRYYEEINFFKGWAIEEIEEANKETKIDLNTIQDAKKGAMVKVKKEKKQKEKKVIDMTIPNELKKFIDDFAINAGTDGEVFDINVKGLYSLKTHGKMYAAYSYSKNGIILWLRSAAMTEEYYNKLEEEGRLKTMKHMFDARVKFDNLDDIQTISNLLGDALEYQEAKIGEKMMKELEKHNKRVAREMKKAEKEAVKKEEAKTEASN